MLISFSVENWQSFREKTTLSLVASREEQHRERITKIDKYKLRILPTAAIYGANASGKTKFFKALVFAQQFILNISQPGSLIPREHFKLDAKCANKPSRFSFELFVDKIIYEFSFAITQQSVVEEKLIKISPYSQKILYDRTLGEANDFANLGIKNEKETQRIKFVFQGTRENQLFLTNSISQNIEVFKPIYNWFKNTLVLISPDISFARSDQLINKEHHLHTSINNTLVQLDTGITRLGGEEVPMINVPLPPDVANEILEGQSVMVKSMADRISIVVSRRNGDLKAEKLVTYHKNFEDEEIPFNFKDESAGTLRAIDLLPGFIDLINKKLPKTYFIDELDRCLHTLLTRKLLETYLSSCSPETHSQLIFTTHDVLLMDQKLLRRDEIWVTERNERGCSSLISFAEYKGIRYDKDIRKSYLQGRLGGIPRILLNN